jgi:hypothetical protein
MFGEVGWYDRKGRKVPLSELNYDIEHRRVAVDDLPNGYRVSTVHLGLNHNFGKGPPLIFETMIFDERAPDFREVTSGESLTNRDNLDCVRYATLKEAIAGHAAMVAKWSKARE